MKEKGLHWKEDEWCETGNNCIGESGLYARWHKMKVVRCFLDQTKTPGWV